MSALRGNRCWRALNLDWRCNVSVLRSSETRNRVIQIISERLGLAAQKFVNVPRLQLDQRLNSLDIVELIMEIEDATP